MHKPDSATATAASFTIHPPVQSVAARCVDVINLGLTVIKAFKPTDKDYTAEKVVLIFFAGERDESGKPLYLKNEFTLTMGSKGRLRPFLESWRGQKYTDEEARKGIQIEKLFGAPALISAAHEQSGDKTYCNITSISPLPKSMKEDIAGMEVLLAEYVRDPYWEKKKAATKEATEAWLRQQRGERVETRSDARGTMTKHTPKGHQQEAGFDDFPDAQDGDDDLPF